MQTQAEATLRPDSIDERAKFAPRAARVKVDFRVAAGLGREPGTGDQVTLHATNLSPSGMLATVAGAMPLIEGSFMNMVLELHQLRHDVTLRIARASERDVALEFVGLSHATRLALVAFVAEQRAEIEAGRTLKEQNTSADWAVVLADVEPGNHPSTERLALPIDIEYHATPLAGAISAAAERPRSASGRFAPWLLAFMAVMAAAAAISWWPGSVGGDHSIMPGLTKPASPSRAAAAPPPAAVDPRIAPLMAEARALFQSGIWSMPEDQSAFGRYRSVLAIDPANRDASAGIAAIAGAYLNRAREVQQAGDPAGARWRYQRALDILGQFPQVAGQAASVDRARRAIAAR